VLRHGAEIAVGVDFVPDRRGPAVMSELLQHFRRSVVDEGDLGVLGCHPSSMFPAELSGLSARPPLAVAVRKVEASRARDTSDRGIRFRLIGRISAV
jgi:hypothetical protein